MKQTNKNKKQRKNNAKEGIQTFLKKPKRKQRKKEKNPMDQLSSRASIYHIHNKGIVCSENYDNSDSMLLIQHDSCLYNIDEFQSSCQHNLHHHLMELDCHIFLCDFEFQHRTCPNILNMQTIPRILHQSVLQ